MTKSRSSDHSQLHTERCVGESVAVSHCTLFPNIDDKDVAEDDEVQHPAITSDDYDDLIVDEEVVEVKIKKKPYEPSKEERRKHNVCHYPYRNWCEFCVKARGPNLPHKECTRDKDEDSIKTFHMDYWFMREFEGDEKVTVITMKSGRWFASHVVSMKGK